MTLRTLADIAANPDSLLCLNVVELRALWRVCCPKRPAPPIKSLLARDLAWIAQCGGTALPRQTDALVRAAIKQTSVSRNAAFVAERTRPPTALATQGLPAGSRLVREWGGCTHEILVLDDGLRYEYSGNTYRSLTQVAKVITGAHWSGPRFFGLHRCREAA